MDPLTIAFSLAQFVPEIFKWLGNDKSATTAQKVVDVAQRVTGKTGMDVVPVLQANPELVLKLQEAFSQLSKSDVENTGQINATMQDESKSEAWPQYSWRPFIALCMGLQGVTNYTILPMFGIIPPPIPDSLWYTYAGILGVATFGRSIMQLFKK